MVSYLYKVQILYPIILCNGLCFCCSDIKVLILNQKIIFKLIICDAAICHTAMQCSLLLGFDDFILLSSENTYQGIISKI